MSETNKPVDFFLIDRGERALYESADLDVEVLLPVTRDGFEALLECASKLFTPPLPVDDSIRKVFAGYVHHMTNETSTTTKAKIGAILYKSIANALTWTMDQEIKAKQQAEIKAVQEKEKALADEAKKTQAEAKRALKVIRRTKYKNGEDEVTQTT